MKTVLTYIFVGIYLISTSGIIVNYHICQGDLVELELYSEVHKCCEAAEPCSETHYGKSCCRLGSMQINVDTNHQTPDLWSPAIQMDQVVSTSFLVIDEVSSGSVSCVCDIRDGPPILVPTYILDCALIFYA
ncbi:MAG: hypothetical protein ACI9RU_000042 [Litorivivens sp.]|jgi:hypothetical protein